MWPFRKREKPATAIDALELRMKLHAVWKQNVKIFELGELIMSQLSDYAAKVKADAVKISADLDKIKTLLTQINNAPGPITPEDQAALDDALGTLDGAANTADSVATPPQP